MTPSIESLNYHARPWRKGQSVGRTVYVQVGANPSKADVLVGVMDTPDLAELVVAAVNARTNQSEVTHRCPTGDGMLTPCCHRSPLELPRTDRLTVDDALVTCARGRVACVR